MERTETFLNSSIVKTIVLICCGALFVLMKMLISSVYASIKCCVPYLEVQGTIFLKDLGLKRKFTLRASHI